MDKRIKFLGYDFYLTEDGTYFKLPDRVEREIAKRVFLEWWEEFLEPDMHRDGFFHRVKSCYMRWLDRRDE